MTNLKDGRLIVPDTRTILGIQYLRGFAALFVVYYHIFSNRVAQSWSAGSFYGLFGVDVFFVISGFIMWRTTAMSTRTRPADFLLRRFIRIYPTWWITLSAWIGIRLILPDSLHNADVDFWSVVDSYLLVPHYHAVFTHYVWPILVPGWTLEMEILFYLLFAGTLFISFMRARLTAILLILAGLSLIGMIVPQSSAVFENLTNPLLLEFAGGIFVASQAERLSRIPVWMLVSFLLIGLALVGFFLGPQTEMSRVRALCLGPSAMLIVAGMVGLEPRLRAKPSSWLLLLGDASYSLYLTHIIAISATAVLWERLRLPMGTSPGAALFIPIALVTTVGASIIFYRLIEKPILKVLIPRNGRRRLPVQVFQTP